MTKTMKKVLTVLLVGILAISAGFMGIFSGSAATPSENVVKFTGIVTNYMDPTTGEGTITDADLADADTQIDLVNAKAYFDKMTEEEKTGLEREYAEAWADILFVAGSALNVYAEMSALSVYIRPVDAPRISVHKLSDVEKADLNHQGLGANSVLFCDMRINYDYAEIDYADGGRTKFFEKLYDEIREEQNRIKEAKEDIEAIWTGKEYISVEDLVGINAAAKAINAVLPSDRSKIKNMDKYEAALNEVNEGNQEFVKTINDAKDLAEEIDALYATLIPGDVYYTMLEEIKKLEDERNSFYPALQAYFKGEKAYDVSEIDDAQIDGDSLAGFAAQNVLLDTMLANCKTIENQIAAVIEKIAAIGTVTYTDESKAKIDAAQALFEALDNDVENAVEAAYDAQEEKIPYVTNYAVLVAAHDRYAKIENAVLDVVAKIDAIDNPVTLTDACNAEITAAEEAYAALAEVDPEFQANVPAYKVAIMEAARAEYIRLENIVKAWIARVEAFYGEGAIADIWAADLAEIKALEDEYVLFDANAKAYADAPKNNNNVTGAKADLDAIKVKAYANIDETEIAIGELKTATPAVIVELLLEAKEMYDTLHATQQAEIDPDLLTILNAKWAKYQAVSYFDKAVAVIKANVDANLYYTQDAALMNTLFVLYNVLDEEGRAMVSSYADLVAIEAVLIDSTLVNAYEYSNELSAKLAKVTEELILANNDLVSKNDELSESLSKANSTATIAMVIAIIAVIAGVVGIVLATKKN